MIKWLLVDIGDVLLLKDPKNTKNFSQLIADELGVDTALAEKINREHYTTMEMVYISEAQFVANLKKNLGYDAPADIYAYFERAYEKQTMPNTKFLNFLDEMRAAGFKTAVLSNTIGIYRAVQERTGITNQGGFDPILFSWEVGMNKPNPAIFELAVERLHAKPEEIVFIDDKLGHLEGAEQVGLRTILFSDTDEVISQLQKLKV